MFMGSLKSTLGAIAKESGTMVSADLSLDARMSSIEVNG
jgi:hypothetical protein